MTSADNLTTLTYLTDAAHILRIAAPETSAHLMSQRASLLHHYDLALSDTQKQHVCAACGHIMIPGDSSKLKLEATRAVRQKGKMPSKVTGLSKEISCGFCDRKTKIALPAPERATRRKGPKLRTQRTANDTEPPKANTSNASSKKRAKNRKTGLQALLSSQQQRQSNPLSLADFMMK